MYWVAAVRAVVPLLTTMVVAVVLLFLLRSAFMGPLRSVNWPTTR